MATIFPPSPSVDDEYQGYKWDGTTWNLIGNQYNPASYSASAPSNPKPGDLWIESDVDVPSISPETILTTTAAASTYATQQNFPAGAWQSYTPVWGSNGTAPALVNGTISGLYSKFGKTVHVRIYMQLGSSSTVGTGQRYSWTLPFNNKQLTTCNLIFLDSSANAYYIGVGRTNATNIDFVMNQFGPGTLTGAGLFGPASPVVPASGDFYILTATYEEV